MSTDNNQLLWSTFRWPSGEGSGWRVLAGNGSRPERGWSTDGSTLESTLSFNSPHGFAVHRSGDVYIADTFSSCIRRPRSSTVATVRFGV